MLMRREDEWQGNWFHLKWIGKHKHPGTSTEPNRQNVDANV